ncbi:MAG: hypothetical protein LBQ68_08210, partial [Clostridiales bacterium]|nr:hypothetical protein [Clostridiales bacterium]
QFLQNGIPSNQIPKLLINTLSNGKIVGYQRTRPIYEIVFNGETQRVAISVGTNGFIVGANPVSLQ